jgi:N-acetyl-anhydromuramyl-L-alanine amidase AmpD
MRKSFEAGILAFICCVVFGIVLAIGSNPKASLGERDLTPPAIPQPQPKVLSPVVPQFKLAADLPTLTPKETRAVQYKSASFQTSDRFIDSALESEFDSTWNELTYGTSPANNQYRIEIDPSNYGDRQATDAEGKPAQNDILIVLHETTFSAESAIHTFLTHHPKDADQVSYHALILIDGRIIHLVPPEKRAYGAGNSEFRSDQGVESVQTNAKYPSSVNNFAYHISLETPIDAHDKALESHSGYSLEQYDSLAWLIQQLNVDASRVTTHKAIDRAQARADPRSFDMNYLGSLLY